MVLISKHSESDFRRQFVEVDSNDILHPYSLSNVDKNKNCCDDDEVDGDDNDKDEVEEGDDDLNEEEGREEIDDNGCANSECFTSKVDYNSIPTNLERNANDDDNDDDDDIEKECCDVINEEEGDDNDDEEKCNKNNEDKLANDWQMVGSKKDLDSVSHNIERHANSTDND